VANIIFSNEQIIENCTQEELEKVKSDLTIISPKYLSAKKYSKYNTVSLPKYLYFYQQYGNNIKVPSGYIFPFKADSIKDKRVKKEVEYPEFVLELRELQKVVANKYLEDTSKGIISMPTGSGKSIIGLYLACKLKQKTLIVVHKEDLVVGWKKDIELAFNKKMKAGLIKAKSRKVGDQITIATIQTLNRLSDEEWNNIKEEFGLIITDELHRCPSKSYDVLHYLKAKYRIGLSATPERNDGLSKLMLFHFRDFAFCYKEEEVRDLETNILPVRVKIHSFSDIYYEPYVYVYSIRGVSKFRLAKPEEYKLPNVVPISEIGYSSRPKISFHDIDDFVVRNKKYRERIVDDILEEYEFGRSIIMFLTQKDHCRYYKELLSEYVDEKDILMFYGDSEEDTETMMKKAESGECKITIATLKKATEGTNVKQWEVAFLVSSMNNGMSVEQAVGRIRRSKEGKISRSIVYDYALPNVYTMKSHIDTRVKRYKELNFEIQGEFNSRKNMFKRGFKNKF